jgi:hypothetical protein
MRLFSAFFHLQTSSLLFGDSNATSPFHSPLLTSQESVSVSKQKARGGAAERKKALGPRKRVCAQERADRWGEGKKENRENEREKIFLLAP